MTPSELVKKVASAFGESEKRLIPLDRVAAEVGLRRSTGGRGGSAPQMVSTDAASLVLMILTHTGGISPNLTADRVRQLWGTPCPLAPFATWSTLVTKKAAAKRHSEVQDFVEGISRTLPDFANALTERGTFRECLSALIEDCISGRMRTFLNKHSGDDRGKCKLKIELPRPLASIEFVKTFEEHEETLVVTYQFLDQRNRNDAGEITTTRHMTVLPLLRIAEDFRA